MDSSYVPLVISAIAATAAIVSAVFVCFYWRVAKRAMIHQALLDVQKDYRSPQMLYAVRTLWQFYREHGKGKFVEKYEEIRRSEEQWISTLDKQKRLEAEQTTLHYLRRLVSHFYQHLAALYVNGILPKAAVYEGWSEADLRIIPEILVPIENDLLKALHTPPLEPLDENCSLLVLYRDSKRSTDCLDDCSSPGKR